MLLSTGVVNEEPVCKAVPPVAVANQLMVPALAAALSVTEAAPHDDAGVTPVMVGIGLMVAVTGVLKLLTQPLLMAST